MNIFVLDNDPHLCATYHNDKHIVKQVLETAQILCTVRHQHGHSDVEYRPTHMAHPCVKWAGTSAQNYRWLCRLGIELCREYTYRYGKIHKSQTVIYNCFRNNPCTHDMTLGTTTNFVLAMPDEYKGEYPVFSYRRYYYYGKRHLAVWTKRGTPFWYDSLGLVLAMATNPQ